LEANGQYRRRRSGNPDTGRDQSLPVISVAKFADAIYVLHCFKKKSAKTSKIDIALARDRYAALLKEHRR
jgi:phage-related protein